MDNTKEKTRDYLNNLSEELRKSISSLSIEEVEKVANSIIESEKNGGRVHVTGVGKPSYVARYIASLFSSIGTPSYFLDATETIHGSAGQVARGDVVIAISNSGKTTELLKSVNVLNKNGAIVVAVTSNSESELSRLSKYTLVAKVDKEGDDLGLPPRASYLSEIVITAMLTPFDENENIDYESTKRLIDSLIDKGINGLFILGTNGEFTSLERSEKIEYAKFVSEYVSNRVPIIIGAGECSTRSTIQLINDLKHLKPYAFSVITPYFHKLSNTELLTHYLKVSESVDQNILLYNIPGLTGNTITSEIYEKLLEKDNIIGIKDSSGSIDLLSSYCKITQKNKAVYIGSDSLFLKSLELGAVGGVSGLSNVIAEDFVKLYELFLNNDFINAKLYQERVNDFRMKMKVGTAPSMLKFVLSQDKVIEKYTRFPIQPFTEGNK